MASARVPLSLESGSLQGGRDKDEKPMRVGGLERVKPTFLTIETLKRMSIGHPGLLWAKAYGRRRDLGPVIAGRVSTLEG
jgi:hypothetical protein